MIGQELIGKYVIVRSNESGVAAGILENIEDNKLILRNSRRIWYWRGSASLSQLAAFGTITPKECRFPINVSRVVIFNAFEIIECSELGEKSINEVPVWLV